MLDGINPNNKKQVHLFYDLQEENEKGESRHPQVVMKELASKFSFSILGAVPQSLFDGWSFWIEQDNPENIPFPDIFRKGIEWFPIGEH